MVERVKRWLDAGIEVRILTARVCPHWADAVQHHVAVSEWTREIFGRALKVTCMKDPEMIELWDDRAVTVRANTGELMFPEPALEDDE